MSVLDMSILNLKLINYIKYINCDSGIFDLILHIVLDSLKYFTNSGLGSVQYFESGSIRFLGFEYFAYCKKDP